MSRPSPVVQDNSEFWSLTLPGSVSRFFIAFGVQLFMRYSFRISQFPPSVRRMKAAANRPSRHHRKIRLTNEIDLLPVVFNRAAGSIGSRRQGQFIG